MFIKKAVKLKEAKAMDKEWDKLQDSPVWDFQNAKPKAEVVRHATMAEDTFILHFL